MRFNDQMKTLGERIKFHRKQRKLTQAGLGRLAGLDQTVISKIECGEIQETAKTPQIAQALGVDALYLATGKTSDERMSELLKGASLSAGPQLGRVPLISMVAAGNWSENVDNYVAGYPDDWIVTTIQVKQHTYALIVEGDSMEPKFPNGATIIVEPEEEARNGSYVIVRQNSTETTFKQLIIDGGQYFLKPLNARYPIMAMRDDAVICGIVKEIRMLV